MAPFLCPWKDGMSKMQEHIFDDVHGRTVCRNCRERCCDSLIFGFKVVARACKPVGLLLFLSVIASQMEVDPEPVLFLSPGKSAPLV